MTGIWRRGDNSFSEEKSPRVSVICGLESCAFSAVGQHFVCLANKNGVSGDFGSYRLCPVCPIPARGTEVFSLGGEGGWSVGRDRRLSPATSPLPCRLSCRAQDSEAGWRRANRFMGWLVHFLVNKPGQNQYVTACGYVTWGLALAERGFARGGFGDAMKPTEENQYWINWVAAGRSGGKILKKKSGKPPKLLWFCFVSFLPWTYPHGSYLVHLLPWLVLWGLLSSPLAWKLRERRELASRLPVFPTVISLNLGNSDQGSFFLNDSNNCAWFWNKTERINQKKLIIKTLAREKQYHVR